VDIRVEIVDNQVTCVQDGQAAFAAPLKSFLSALVEKSEHPPLPDAIPESVRFIRRRGDAVVLALEEKPALRTVRWLKDDSPAPYGRKAVYETVRLAFPFVVLVIAFRSGALTGYQQCFYRAAPLQQWNDELMLPNLLNVAKGHGQECWLCLVNLEGNLAPFFWNEKVRRIWNHVFGTGFNASSEVHEGMSYWGKMRSIDPRVESLTTWEQASKADPYFVLEVPWKPYRNNVGTVMDEMLTAVAPSSLPVNAAGLAQLLSQVRARPRFRWPWAK